MSEQRILMVKGYSVTIEGDQVKILHKPGDSDAIALRKHQEILDYMRQEGYFDKPEKPQ